MYQKRNIGKVHKRYAIFSNMAIEHGTDGVLKIGIQNGTHIIRKVKICIKSNLIQRGTLF